MTDEYSHVGEDVKYRKMVAEQAGIGFELPVQTLSIAPNAPNCTEKVEVESVA